MLAFGLLPQSPAQPRRQVRERGLGGGDASASAISKLAATNPQTPVRHPPRFRLARTPGPLDSTPSLPLSLPRNPRTPTATPPRAPNDFAPRALFLFPYFLFFLLLFFLFESRERKRELQRVVPRDTAEYFIYLYVYICFYVIDWIGGWGRGFSIPRENFGYGRAQSALVFCRGNARCRGRGGEHFEIRNAKGK